MDKYKLKFTRLQNEIFRLLCIRAGEELNQRQISQLLQVTSTAVSKALKALCENELISVITGNFFKTITLNRNNLFSLNLKRVENLKLIYESKILDYLEDFFPGTTIILFGSYSRGDDIISSDLDLAIIGTKKNPPNLEKWSNYFEREINLQIFANWKEIKKPLKENILNGTTLIGGIEL